MGNGALGLGDFKLLFVIICQALPITDYRLPITDYQLPITDYQFPIPHSPFPITNSSLLGVRCLLLLEQAIVTSFKTH